MKQAIKLKELGVTQKSLFYWNNPKSEKHPQYIHYGWTSDAVASAFNASELIVLLNGGIQFFSEESFTVSRLAADLINDIQSGHYSIKSMNNRLDKLFEDRFSVFVNN